MIEASSATKSILLVEDNEVTREGLATVLRHHGYSTREAVNGREALEALRAEKPDLILLDMLLPGGQDGWGLLARLKMTPEWRSIPVVIVTSMAIACEEWAASLGARGVVRKPIDTDELLQKLRRYCS